MMKMIINAKRIVLLIIILLVMDINVHAAVVFNSNGNNFITKEVFEDLKNNFSEQINRYNASLSSKTEGAIAEYLAGVTLAKTKFLKPFYTIDSSTSLKVVSPETGVLSRTKPNYNKISLSFTMGRTDAQVGNNITPFTTGSGWFAMGASTGAVLNGQGSGFITKEDNVDVVSEYWTDCYLNLAGGCSCFGLGITGSSYHFYKFNPFLNMKLNQAYTQATLNSARGQSGNIPESTYRNDNPTSPSMFSNYKLGSSVFIVSLEKNTRDDTVYLFNNCNETNINTWNEKDEDLACYDDTNVDSILNPSYPNEKCTNSIRIPLNQFCCKSGSSTPTAGILQFNKLYIKQQKAIDAGHTSGFDNLNQLKNGSLKYTINGVDNYPKFYGGLPLFITDSDMEEMNFTIKIAPTTAGYTGKMKLWIKEGEFVNSDDFNSALWNTPDGTGRNPKDCLMTMKVEDESMNADKSINIKADTETDVTIKNVQKDCVYFLRFCEADKTYGGEIKLLNNFNYTD